MNKFGNWRKYVRLNVEEFVEEWIGWEPLISLIGHAKNERNKAFLATLFLTGGRVTEVLSLRKENFEIREFEGLIVVRGMRLLKRYRKVGEIEENGKKKWITEKLVKTRKPFPILLNEPLTHILLDWLDKVKTLLFPSPYNPGRPLTRFWAYKLIRKIDSTISENLREKLGLNKPFTINGERVSDRIHLWPHWFRSQRACQLVSDYGFQLHDLIDWFSWEHVETAMRYSKRGWRGLAQKMKVAVQH